MLNLTLVLDRNPFGGCCLQHKIILSYVILPQIHRIVLAISSQPAMQPAWTTGHHLAHVEECFWVHTLVWFIDMNGRDSCFPLLVVTHVFMFLSLVASFPLCLFGRDGSSIMVWRAATLLPLFSFVPFSLLPSYCPPAALLWEMPRNVWIS
jgi:hypothetical protein